MCENVNFFPNLRISLFCCLVNFFQARCYKFYACFFLCIFTTLVTWIVIHESLCMTFLCTHCNCPLVDYWLKFLHFISHCKWLFLCAHCNCPLWTIDEIFACWWSLLMIFCVPMKLSPCGLLIVIFTFKSPL